MSTENSVDERYTQLPCGCGHTVAPVAMRQVHKRRRRIGQHRQVGPIIRFEALEIKSEYKTKQIVRNQKRNKEKGRQVPDCNNLLPTLLHQLQKSLKVSEALVQQPAAA